jgi:hypothetical protein
VPYSTLRDKKNELIRKARDGSVFISAFSADGITDLTTGTPTNEVQTATITGTPTGGNFRLTYSGQQTATILFDAVAGAVQTALEALSNIGAGNVSVTGGPGPGTPYVITFQGDLSGTDVALITATHTFTGGTSPDIAVVSTTPGSGIDLSPLPSGWEDLGWCSTDGVTYGRETEVSEVNSFGSTEPTRADITSDTITMSVTAQETRLLTVGLYTGADTAGLVADATTGEFSIAKPSTPGFRYYRVLGLFVDRDDNGREIFIARYMPRARITEFGEQQYQSGEDPVSYNMTFTGFEDSVVGYSHRWIFGGPGWFPLLATMGIPTA